MKNEEIKAHIIGYLPDTDIRKKVLEIVDNQPQWISVEDSLPKLIHSCKNGTAYSEAVRIYRKNLPNKN